MDQRRNRRYQLPGRVDFSWIGADGLTRKGEGSTRDISVTGVYVQTSDLPAVGSVVWLKVALPPLRVEGEGIQLRNQVYVIRSETGGFAALADLDSGLELEHGGLGRKGSALDAPRRSDSHRKREGCETAEQNRSRALIAGK